jgi:hypothetical protein
MSTNDHKSRFEGLFISFIGVLFLGGLTLFGWTLHTTHQLSGDVRSIIEERSTNSKKQESSIASLVARLERIEHASTSFADLTAIESILDGIKNRIVVLESFPRSGSSFSHFDSELKETKARIDSITSSITQLRTQLSNTVQSTDHDDVTPSHYPELTQTIDDITMNVTKISRLNSILIVRFEIISPTKSIQTNSRPDISGVITQDSSSYIASSILVGHADNRVGSLRMPKGAKAVGEMRIDGFPQDKSVLARLAIVFDNLAFDWTQKIPVAP